MQLALSAPAATLRRSMRLIVKIVQTSNGAPRSPRRSTKLSTRHRHSGQHSRSRLKTKFWIVRFCVRIFEKHVILWAVGVSAQKFPANASAVVIERFKHNCRARPRSTVCRYIAIAQGLDVKVIIVNGRQFQNSILDIWQ